MYQKIISSPLPPNLLNVIQELQNNRDSRRVSELQTLMSNVVLTKHTRYFEFNGQEAITITGSISPLEDKNPLHFAYYAEHFEYNNSNQASLLVNGRKLFEYYVDEDSKKGTEVFIDNVLFAKQELCTSLKLAHLLEFFRCWCTHDSEQYIKTDKFAWGNLSSFEDKENQENVTVKNVNTRKRGRSVTRMPNSKKPKPLPKLPKNAQLVEAAQAKKQTSTRIEKVLKKRMLTEYYVEYNGAPKSQNSWIPEAEVSKDLIRKFEQRVSFELMYEGALGDD